MVTKLSWLQCRMARAACGLGVRQLADRAGVSPDTVARLEREETLKPSTTEAIRTALEAEGLEFIDADESFGGEGVRFAYAYTQKSRPNPEEELERLSVIVSNEKVIRLRTTDGRLPIEIDLDPAQIESRYCLNMDSEARRERVVDNIASLQLVVDNYYKAGRYKIVRNGSKFLIRIVLEPPDLASALEFDDDDEERFDFDVPF
jgi:transcriptional regulator with XRE-family HTH domain